MSTAILYGIKNCGTVREARKWLENKDIEYRFHDFRVDGLDEKDLRNWVKTTSWETLLNRRGTTWRQLPEADKEDVDEQKALRLMLAQPTLIKRPVLVNGKQVHVGFKSAEYDVIF